MAKPTERTEAETGHREGDTGTAIASKSPDGAAPPSPSPETPPAGQARRKPDKSHRHWGRRKRRLRRAAAILAGVAVVGTIAGVLIYRATRPEEYRPGEETEGITERLSRGLPEDAPEPRLTDVTDEAGLGGFVSFTGTRSSQLPEDMGSGLAWGDFDNDGDEDLFVVAAGGPLTADPSTWAESVLYENLLFDRNGERGNATFRRSDAFPGLRIIGMAAAWADVDGDGWLDLAVSGYHALLLFHNDHGRLVPDERFARDLTQDGADLQDGYWAGISWGDYDNDRDPDLYVTGYVRYQEDPNARDQVSQQYGHAVPYTLNPVSYDPERNLLLRNDGDGTFTEVGKALGVDNPAGRSLGALWRDFDDDGRLDLYVANDVSDNAFYRNTTGTAGGTGGSNTTAEGSTEKAEGSTGKAEGSFEDIGLAAWVADYRGAMGLAAGDWNRDGDDDLFVTHWVAQENALYDNLLADARPAPPGPSGPPTGRAAEARKGPALPAGVGFSDRAVPLGLGQIALHFVGWGTELADFDGDGWLDLLVINGSTFEAADDPTELEPQVPLFLWNRRGEHFHDLAPLSPVLSQPHVGRGMALADYDQDGDLDAAIVHYGEGVQLLRNDMQTGRWVELRLRSLGPSGELTGRGEGATVIAHAGDTILRRSVTGASYLSQSTRTVHFGLGAADRLDTVEVHWLGGGTDTYQDLQTGTIWELRQGDPAPRMLATPSPGPAPSSGTGSPATTSRPAEPRSPAAADSPAATNRLGAANRPVAANPPEATNPPEAAGAGHLTERERIARFWQLQRAGMDAIKTEHDPAKAEGYFRQALALDPDHEDAHYYLAAALAAQGRTDEALEHLKRLTEINPQSHRGFKRWGTLRALTARGPEDLSAAAKALERSHEINKEETGSLLVLGEIDLLRGDTARARQHLQWATTTNARAVGGQFLLGYIDWKQGHPEAARQRLQKAREALGPDWTPQGTTSEGDTEETMHEEESPLGRFVRGWDGEPDPNTAYAGLGAFLQGR